MVRALHYITGRLPVLIQAVCFCPSGECALTLFKSSESKPTISNKQNTSHRTSLREAQPLLQLVCLNESSLTKGHLTFYNPRCMSERNETSERIDISQHILHILHIGNMQNMHYIDSELLFCILLCILVHIYAQ